MFRENKQHLQDNLFNSLYSMDSRLAQKLQNSWAALFYKHVFCQIDEKLFAPLYSNDNGRPNFPVNILMGLDLIKEIRGYTDEVLLDEYAFNYQISFALGLRTLGERYFAPRTLYEFRARLYHYSLEHPEEADLIYAQFEKLTDHFIDVAGLNTDEVRMDSTLIMSNIKLAGRLSLTYDVLVNGIKVLPKHLLKDSLKVFLQSDYKTQLLYKLKGKDILSRIQSLINHCSEVLQQVEEYPDLKAKTEIQRLERFLKEQATYSEEENSWIAKDQCPQKEICRVKFQKKDTVLRVSQKALIAEQTRLKIEDRELRKEATNKRVAIEGTNSTLKRAHGVDKLSVRGIIKSKLVVGAKIIAHNFRQLTRFFQGYDRRKLPKSNQGIPVAI